MARITVGATAYRLDAVRDTPDFRDLLFTPTLVEVPATRPLEDYRAAGVPILDQGTEGACTGFGLATVIHYLLRRRRPVADEVCVSPRMLYEMAKRYDEWPGEGYEGSSARGAMKGWHKHGVCAEALWPYHGRVPKGKSAERWTDARLRPLGAYFRVNHRDLIAMHAALAEVGVLYATATVHEGWSAVGDDGWIEPSERVLGGHAFAIVAYDRDGFWIQNSWGESWGKDGFGHVTYDDWLANGTDVWVARLGAPVVLKEYASTSVALQPSAHAAAYSYGDLRPHIVSTGNDGRLRAEGTYGTDEEAVRHIFRVDVPKATAGWARKRLLLYAHGGLVPEDAAVQRLADYRSALLERQVYPLSFIWKTDFWTTLRYILEDALRRRRPEGVLDAAKDFMLDRLDDALEPLARIVGGKAQWDEMKENALRATTGAGGAKGGARIAAEHVAALASDGFELHMAAHSAGSIYFARLVQMLTADRGRPVFRGVRGLGVKIESVTLWAPAITIDLFKQTYLPAIREGRIGRFALFTLTDHAEQEDDCANIYNKSLLYLVSHALEATPRIPLIGGPRGEPILGMERWVREDLELMDLFESGRAEWIRAPNAEPSGSPTASRARSHGDFDDDEATVRATLVRILGEVPAGDGATAGPIRFERSAASRRAEREVLMQVR